MDALIRNISTEKVRIPDLAIEFDPQDEIDLIAYRDEDFIKSVDIKLVLDKIEIIQIIKDTEGNIINENIVNYNIISQSKYLLKNDHETLHTLKHNISDNSFFEAIKENNLTKYITYYTDATKTKKLREEEITRGVDGRVNEIIAKNYDINGEIINTEIQTLNRNASTGKVDNISTSVE